ncbi:putative ribosome quality control (RQC) complex YloA/Tae2 family protein [Scopulibacillus darangshiensis]|uniref:Rqc2 homolog RqcH n=1 Tax=Scopulibacillus darangshiensis TaxID=442528 RepID=A0A4R2P385_9BACL|nr:NFACT RNA binding domain-containing protein [Scopulibacillus darangshiensis]TCP29122.1 putative ribosome quality control (RQC) complex YloA/Tae2 family protein [Scopulibacillus darangshiensis]
MVYDGIVTRAVTKSLQILPGGRLSKIYQPHPSELLFHVRAHGSNYKLLLSTNAQFARYHLTKATYDNPKEPSMFCMLLRKHLEGSIIDSLEQVGCERIVHLDFRAKNEFGDLTYKRLIIELMGRHSNIILTDRESGRIVDSIKHLSPSMNSYRTVMPGLDYISPPHQDKLNPLEATPEDLLRVLDFNAGRLENQIVQAVSGFSPQLAKEMLHQAGLPHRDAVAEAFANIQEKLNTNKYQPAIIYSPNGKDQFHVIEMSHLKGNHDIYQDVNKMLEHYYATKAESDLVKQKANDLHKFISNEKKKNHTKLKKLNRTLKEAEESATFQLYGELLTANMHLMKKGDEKIEAVNYYDENQEKITIALNPNKTPSENAQFYYKKYNKAKTAKKVVEQQINMTEQEIDYFDRLMQQIESASLKDVEEIRDELEEGGYLKKRKKKQSKNHKQKPHLEHYYSSNGTLILVGKNNKQNDYLTTKEAKTDETWLHTKDIPGSHVVIRTKDVTENTLLEAANLAAYFSKSKMSSSVPVDYTLIKHVKKPNGAKPGYVIYDHQKTIYVTPDEQLVLKLKDNANDS